MSIVDVPVRDPNEEARAEEAHQIQEQIKSAMRRGREALWDLAAALYEFDQRSGWTALGYEKQTDWLADTDIGMTARSFFRLVRLHREMHVMRQIPTTTLARLDASKVDIVLPSIEDNKVKIDEALSDVQALGARDLRDKYGPPKPIPAPEKPEKDRQPVGAEPVTADDVIEGSATTIESTPAEAGVADEKLTHAVAVVDSWFWGGGDKRKAVRNWEKIKELHPVFMVAREVELSIAGGEGAPSRQEAHRSWEALMLALNIQPTE